ncbi:unnamed protein product [Dovyalis caffra]|uniref:Uncharacterized protein n=1 Tax=Dovyalis caffra TaxID=77055 RepID=A0AAV1RCG3_9ROSI|nr:unnamed protein product [Dovyalis caffra]
MGRRFGRLKRMVRQQRGKLKLALNENAKAPIVAKVFKDGSRAENAFVYHLEVYSDSPTLG